jgi:uncharacterized protein (TIGR02118 family)
MFKVVMLLNKKPELTREQFIDYYDNRHVPLVHSLLPKGAAVHRRNFVAPGQATTGDCDAVVEVFYEDLETAQAAMHAMSDPAIRQRVEADEDQFIQRGSIRRFIVEVHETIYRPLP